MVGLALFFFPFPIYAADSSLLLAPIQGGPYQVGESFEVGIFAKTGGNTIDTIRANLSFPPDLLEVQDISFGSVYTVATGGNGFDDSLGTISWGGGVFNGTTQDATFVTITFRVRTEGLARVDFTLGTKILSNGQLVPMRSAGGTYALGIEAAAELPLPSFITEDIRAIEDIEHTITRLPGKGGAPPTYTGVASIHGALIEFDIDDGLVAHQLKLKLLTC